MALTLKLHPYQEEPVQQFLQHGCWLVAYAPGLGKTIIATAAAEELLEEDEIRQCLIVVPASLKWQWAQRLAQYTDTPTVTLKVKGDELTVPDPSACQVIDGPPAKREQQYESALGWYPTPYLIASYETVVRDWKHIARLPIGMVILDEASAIKGFRAKRTKRIKKLLDVSYRMALTATPVENKPEEAFSIMQWVDDSVLGRYDLFDRSYIVRNHFGGIKRYKNLPLMHERLAARMSRKDRTDPDVKPYLPEVDEGEWTVDLAPALRKAYDQVAGELLTALQGVSFAGTFDLHAYYNGASGSEGNSAMGKVMAMQLALEMLLDHPDLVIRSGMDYEESEELRRQGIQKASWPGSEYCYKLWQSGLLDDLTTSAKTEYLREKVPDILGFSDESKIVLFSRFRYMLDIIEDELALPCIQYHGDLNAKEKAAAVSHFASDPDVRVMLSSHSGAYGTDLPMCDYLINFDLPWSAGMAEQINGRHVRASSEFGQVYIRNLITAGTIEERKLEVLRWKRRTAEAILTGRGTDARGSVENSVASLTQWLRA